MHYQSHLFKIFTRTHTAFKIPLKFEYPRYTDISQHSKIP